MRNRIEDLGRLMVKIEAIIDNDVFYNMRTKTEFMEFYSNGKEDDSILFDRIEKLCSSLAMMKDQLYDCLDIAKGEDYLNQPPDAQI